MKIDFKSENRLFEPSPKGDNDNFHINMIQTIYMYISDDKLTSLA